MSQTRLMLAASLLGAAALLTANTAGAGSSPVVGLYKVALTPGPNFLSSPLQRPAVLKATVASVSGNTVTFAGSPRMTPGAFNEQTIEFSRVFTQYILVLTRDASASPGNTGDWFGVVSNTDSTLTLLPAATQTPAASLAAGDEVEIRKLTSFKDIFGAGTTCILNKDDDLDPSVATEDIVRFMDGTSFQVEVFYHDGSAGPGTEGYYVDGEHDPDGSRITVAPDEPIMLFRRTGSINAVIMGNVQSVPLSHYLVAGANAVSTGFPVDAPVGTSGLRGPGWVDDSDLDPNAATENIVNRVVGTSFTDQAFYHNGAEDGAGWYVNGDLNNNWGLPPAGGLIMFIKNPMTWRQSIPFSL